MGEGLGDGRGRGVGDGLGEGEGLGTGEGEGLGDGRGRGVGLGEALGLLVCEVARTTGAVRDAGCGWGTGWKFPTPAAADCTVVLIDAAWANPSRFMTLAAPSEPSTATMPPPRGIDSPAVVVTTPLPETAATVTLATAGSVLSAAMNTFPAPAGARLPRGVTTSRALFCRL